MHSDNGRRLRTGQNFQRMTMSNGHVSRAVASWACPRWRAYLADVYGRMAELGFDTIWIEDDFRFHGHGGTDVWGGDFQRVHAAPVRTTDCARNAPGLENVRGSPAYPSLALAWLALCANV